MRLTLAWFGGGIALGAVAIVLGAHISPWAILIGAGVIALIGARQDGLFD